MTPAGYLYKKVEKKSDWFNAENIKDIYSLSPHISKNFTDYIDYWLHNGYWLFDSPDIMEEIIRKENIKLGEMTLFYYEVHELEYDDGEWAPFLPEKSFTTNIKVPDNKILEGFDVVTFSCRTTPECSPLSCCNLAGKIQVNEHCLLESFQDAEKALSSGFFDNSEPGPFRIFAVYSNPVL